MDSQHKGQVMCPRYYVMINVKLYQHGVYIKRWAASLYVSRTLQRCIPNQDYGSVNNNCNNNDIDNTNINDDTIHTEKNIVRSINGLDDLYTT